MFDPSSLKNSSLEGKVAIVTGSTQGLGEAIAHLFAERGIAGLVITGRNAERGAKVKSALEKKGVKTVFVAADLASMEDTRKVVAEADKAFGRVDILVNSAGITDRGYDLGHKPRAFRRDVRGQRARAVLPDAGLARDHEAREDRGVDRQHHLDVGPWRAELHHRLLRLEGRTDHADAQRRLFGDEPPHPRQRADHRPHGYARRGPHHEDLPWRQGRLAGTGRTRRSRSAVCSIRAKWRARSLICRVRKAA